MYFTTYDYIYSTTPYILNIIFKNIIFVFLKVINIILELI